MAILRCSRLALLIIRRQPGSLWLFRDLHTTGAFLSREEGSQVQTPTGNAISHSVNANEPSGSRNLGLQPTDLLALYRGLVARGEIEYDEDQVRAVMRVRVSHILPIGVYNFSYLSRSRFRSD